MGTSDDAPAIAYSIALSQQLKWLWMIYAGILGALIGSFLNVVISRVPEGLSVVRPRSRCPRCDSAIAWYDNIPLLSFAVLRARCRHCKVPISWQYPLVELLCSALGVVLWWRHGMGVALFFDASIVALLVALAVIDARSFELPEVLNWPIIGIALLGRLLSPMLDDGATLEQAWYVLRDGLLGGAVGLALLGGVAIAGTRIARATGRIAADEDAMGMGDLILITGLGCWVGAFPILAVIFLASVQGSIIGALLLLYQKYFGNDVAGTVPEVGTESEPSGTEPELESTNQVQNKLCEDTTEGDNEDWQPPPYAVPFGPFLALGAVQWALFSPYIQPKIDFILGKFGL